MQALHITRITVVAVILLLMYFAFRLAPLITHQWGVLEPYAWIASIVVTFVLSLLGIKLDPWHLRGKLQNKLYRRLLTDKLNRYSIDYSG
jgi:uncharacterized membrane protein YqjE